jgi:NAD+ synthase (glutamine-hydrolysing)
MIAFHSLYAQGFVRVAVAAPTSRVADPEFNRARIADMCAQAHAAGAGLVVFPELGLSSYAIDDLLHQRALLDGVEKAAAALIVASREWMPVVLVGAPVRWRGRLYNCALVIHRGALLGVVPKSYLPNYREFYERRHFASGLGVQGESVEFTGRKVPFGTDLIFEAADLPGFRLAAEICEDVWVPVPPSALAALAGATVIANLSASNAVVGKADYRHLLCKAHSGRCLAAYVYSAAGPGESTTDLAWDGQVAIYENGRILAEAPRFAAKPELLVADVDLDMLLQERMQQGTFGDNVDALATPHEFRRIGFRLSPPLDRDLGLERQVSRFPFVPNDDARLAELCFEAFNIQAHGLRQRLEATGMKKVVIGISGGLDSTHALLVAVTAFEQLGLPRENILAWTLPAFATSGKTKASAWALMKALGVTAAEVDMTAACKQMLDDLGHPAARGEKVYDATFENVQAGARTSFLFRAANANNGIVVGTGDLSEIALGWCTYGVGDQMSHYNVNASVPKTLIQHLIRWCIADGRFGAQAKDVLEAILATEISPELVPGNGDGPAQLTEDFVGPYALQDFNLYYATRYGFAPRRIAFLALQAWGDAAKGGWPPNLAADKKIAYDLATIKKWLRVFVTRFFATSQFKRSALPNGPKVTSGGSLSPRGDWRAPSDSSAAAWLADVETIP